MRYAILFCALCLALGCTSEGVKSISTGSVYEYQGIYLKRITINGTEIFLRCDAEGVPLSGRSNDVSISYRSGKQTKNVTYVGE
jgi:hypothetical protein